MAQRPPISRLEGLKEAVGILRQCATRPRSIELMGAFKASTCEGRTALRSPEPWPENEFSDYSSALNMLCTCSLNCMSHLLQGFTFRKAGLRSQSPSLRPLLLAQRARGRAAATLARSSSSLAEASQGEAARASTSRWQLLSHLHFESEAVPQAYHLEMPLFFAACLILFASIPKMNLMFYKD